MKARQISEFRFVSTTSRDSDKSNPGKHHHHHHLISPTSFPPVNLHKARYLLLSLAFLSSLLSVFFLALYPILQCSPIHSNRQLLLLRTVGKLDDAGVGLVGSNISIGSSEFWEQPDGLGYRPCLNFSEGYYKEAAWMRSRRNSRRLFLIPVVSGGLNQQKNQIADAVVVARILEASLVLPVLSVDSVWGDESEFSDIFDDQHFKKTLKDDVHVVATLPASYLRKRPLSPVISASFIDEEWIKFHLMGPLKKNGVTIIRGFDSKLSKDLNPDLQKLRCKVAFNALKFRDWIEELGDKLTKRMAQGGPYMALHLRLEKDVWVRTGCGPGLDREADLAIESARASHAGRFKTRFNITSQDRYLAGLCPLNATEVARLLKGLGAQNNTRIYWAGGVPYGGERALDPLRSQFPNLYNKWALSQQGELDSIKHKSSVLAAVDYLVCLKSHVFMANHGGNMGRALQGHRAFLGHRKHITPNKKQFVQLLLNDKEISESEMDRMIKEMHERSMGSPLMRRRKSGKDVIGYPVPECMCNERESRASPI